MQPQPCRFSPSLFLCRYSDVFSSSFTHATVNLQHPSRIIVLYQTPGLRTTVLQSPVMPNSRRSSATQSVRYFSFPHGPCFPAFSSSTDMTLLSNLWSPMRSNTPTTTTSSCARLFRCSCIRFARGVFVRRGYVCLTTCSRLLGFEATPYGMLFGAWCSGPSGGFMSRIRIRKSLLPRTSSFRPLGAVDLPLDYRTAPACSA